jgi:peptidoglycan/xylan/chitin deacetylase (PgdA/CDA1 family)
MGIRKSGWIIGGCLLILMVGFLCTKYTVHHYLHAKAAGNESINQPVNDTKRIKDVVNDARLEKEWFQKQQNKAIAYQRKIEISSVPAPKPNTAVVPVSTSKPAAPANPPATTAPAAKPVQPPAQPAGSGKRTVYLTFDDGPESFSKDIIALLQKYHFKATFFMLDPNIKRYPDAVKAMVQAGESIGSHGVTHNKKLFYASQASVIGEMDQTRNTLKLITGIDSYLIRTPYGSAPYMTPEYKKAVSDHGYLLWDWNIDSKDWYYKDARYVDSVIEQISKKNGNGPIVILLHERRETLAYLPKLFDYLSKQNFECKAIESSIAAIHF